MDPDLNNLTAFELDLLHQEASERCDTIKAYLRDVRRSLPELKFGKLPSWVVHPEMEGTKIGDTVKKLIQALAYVVPDLPRPEPEDFIVRHTEYGGRATIWWTTRCNWSVEAAPYKWTLVHVRVFDAEFDPDKGTLVQSRFRNMATAHRVVEETAKLFGVTPIHD